MHEEFWQARWARNEIGFHLKEVNPHLQACWAQLAVPAGSEVLVPLCGKSLDMPWLAAQGQRVLGIELAAKAVTDFFAEQGLSPAVRADGALQRHEDAGIAVLQGDFFAVEPAQTAGCTAFYDRAALIALPAEMRRRYVAQLQRLLPAGAVGMLVTLDYPQEQMSGPPFAVDDAEVRALYGEGWELELLLCSDALEGNWRFIERGLSRLEERVYRLRRRG
ncbi:thiopurine S-methyltransferase [Geopseudomonas guangdongensis]|uniref:Thiopurine S-methyltransferase n=1 Tax=Geopseudomonas guangdongensis TaxID=1245526 RepID=A0A1H2I923_9GAMM|nr:thiopurine S-methyltransferase [Pseudomonas guangdongensis]SDU40647.1 thiopurine S-methyltransferase [Pseudomonas guangdongensis]